MSRFAIPERRGFANVLDLLIVTGIAVAGIVVTVVAPFDGTGLRTVFAPLLVLFVPGYGAVVALFPAKNRERASENVRPADRDGSNDGGIDVAERLGLAVGISVLVSSFVGLLLSLSRVGLEAKPAVVTIGGLGLVFIAIASVRRRRLGSDRSSVSVRAPYRTLRAAVAGWDRRGMIVRTALAFSVVVTTGMVGYTLFAPAPHAQDTGLYLLTRNNTTNATATDYPLNYTRGESRRLTVGLTNHEGRTVDYTVAVQLQRVRTTANRTIVVNRERLHRFETRTGANGTWSRRHAITPDMVGNDVRVMYLLYRGPPPADPTAGNAYRTLRLDINVTEGR